MQRKNSLKLLRKLTWGIFIMFSSCHVSTVFLVTYFLFLPFSSLLLLITATSGRSTRKPYSIFLVLFCQRIHMGDRKLTICKRQILLAKVIKQIRGCPSELRWTGKKTFVFWKKKRKKNCKRKFFFSKRNT